MMLKSTSKLVNHNSEKAFKRFFGLGIITMIMMIVTSGSLYTAYAIMPPVRNISLTSNQPTSSTVKYTFTVFDEQRGINVSSDTGTWSTNKITTPLYADGVIAWITDIGTSTPERRANYSIYDPFLGTWKTETVTIDLITYKYVSGTLSTNNGMVFFSRYSDSGGGTGNNEYLFRIYDPQLHAWQGFSRDHYITSTGINTGNVVNPVNLTQGIAYWTYTQGLGSGTYTLTLFTLTYDCLRASWKVGSIEHNISNATYNSSSGSGTVYYSISNQGNYVRGYNGDNGNWSSNITIPLAFVIPTQPTGSVPLKTYFWDMSIGGSSWNYNFGDGGTSNIQSPIYTYNSAIGTPYTATQTVSGPGGTRSRSVTITPTTPHSISGNIANVTGFKIPNATVTLSGSQSKTTQTDSNGNFSFTNLTANGNYTISVNKTGYTSFLPQVRTFNNLSGSQTGNFIGKLNDKVADFNGNGVTDLSVFRPGTTSWLIQGTTTTVYGATTDKIFPRDFDGDGKTDIAVWRPGDGNWYIIKSSNQTFTSIGFGLQNDIPVANDYDGDDKVDVAVFRPSNQNWYVLRSSDNQLSTNVFGLETDKPVPSDYDGDNKTDIAVFRPSTAYWYYIRSSDSQFVEQQVGVTNDIAVPGDYDGDGKTDLATFSNNNQWFIKQSSNSVLRSEVWGTTGDKPVPGDYDGDNKYDVSVYRPSEGKWYIIKSSDQTYFSEQWGNIDDFPLPSSYIPQ